MSRQPTTGRERIEKIVLALIFLPLILPLIIVALLLFVLHRLALYLLVWVLWVPKGKDTLFVYSDSPIWHDYMTQQVLPLVQDRAARPGSSHHSELVRAEHMAKMATHPAGFL